MCFPHVINICCKHIIANLTNANLADSVNDFLTKLPPGPTHWQTFEDTMQWDPVALGHNIVHAL